MRVLRIMWTCFISRVKSFLEEVVVVNVDMFYPGRHVLRVRCSHEC
jgi:hypothetical protein